MIRKIVLVAVGLGLAACAAIEDRDTEIVAGGPNEVSVRAADGVDPGPAAVAHCAQYGKQAVRRLVTPIPDGGTPGVYIYPFACL